MKTRGFSLIELVVVLAIIALLASGAMVFGKRWSDGFAQTDTRNQIVRGVGMAQAFAVRNPHGVPQGQVVVKIQVQNGRFAVVDASTREVIWSTPVPSDVGVQTNAGGAFVCAQWDSRRTSVIQGDCLARNTIYVTRSGHRDLAITLL